jgi:hypothetical protein
MPEQKRQHFVPQFYLRNFSVDPNRKLICLYALRSGVLKRDVPIKEQGYEDYYYGKDNGVESALGKLEQVVSPIIARALTDNLLPTPGSADHAALLKFVILQHDRTPARAAVLNEAMEKTIKTLANGFEDLRNKAREFEMDGKETPLIALASAEELSQFANDLAWKLAGNKTSRPFLASDHPAVFYNQFLETRKEGGGITGIASRGLQIFFPLGPRHLLMLYDKNVYRVGGRKQFDAYIETSIESDVAGFNSLQAANADEVLYFSADASDSHVREAIERGMPFRPSEKTVVRELPAIGPNGEAIGSIIDCSPNDVRLGFRPSFCAILPSATPPKDRWSVELRDPKRVAQFQEQIMQKMPIDPRQFLESVFQK